MTFTAIDCQSFAGGFTLGMTKAGFHLVGKREHPGGFGVSACEANRHLLGNDWTTELGTAAEGWTPKTVDVVFGNPPCSGFSLASNPAFRGANSPINHCMWDFVRFGAKCDATVLAFESVQQAFQRPDGHAMMLDLRAELERLTNDQWTLTHLKHNAYALGGVAIRPRYFWVASRTALGNFFVDPTPLDRHNRPVLWDAIGDLNDLELTWEPQPYGSAPVSEYATRWSLRDPASVVDGMMTHNPESLHAQKVQGLFEVIDWLPGDTWDDTARRVYERDGKLPYPWTEAHVERGIRKEWRSGYFPIKRWLPDAPARVITGAGVQNSIHPFQPRQFTHREVARVMGFPDTWTCLPWAANKGSEAFWGKGITVHCGEWLGNQIKANLDDAPLGDHTGQLIGDREYVIDIKPSKERL